LRTGDQFSGHFDPTATFVLRPKPTPDLSKPLGLKLEFDYEASAGGFLRVEGAFSLQVGENEFPLKLSEGGGWWRFALGKASRPVRCAVMHVRTTV
jgi:hypothetical protein